VVSSTDIAQRIIEAVLAQRLAPGARLGEQALSLLFDCSRTQVREALMRLATKGIVTVSSRRGWYVVQPSHEEAREAFEARRVIEMGLIRQAGPMEKNAIGKLRQHLKQERAALKGTDVGQRSYLLGDFHVCLAECLGNQLLADTLRDFTAHTTRCSRAATTPKSSTRWSAETPPRPNNSCRHTSGRFRPRCA
jgi:DNA-binding GntR family transcriptional regulator